MAANIFAEAVGSASETDKATLAQFILDALAQGGVPHDDAAKRLIVAAMDRFADEGGTV